MEREFRALVEKLKDHWEAKLLIVFESWELFGFSFQVLEDAYPLTGPCVEDSAAFQLRSMFCNDNLIYHVLQTAIPDGNYEYPGLPIPWGMDLSDGMVTWPKRVGTIIELAAEWACALDLLHWRILQECYEEPIGIAEHFNSLPLDQFKQFPVAIQREFSKVTVELSRMRGPTLLMTDKQQSQGKPDLLESRSHDNDGTTAALPTKDTPLTVEEMIEHYRDQFGRKRSDEFFLSRLRRAGTKRIPTTPKDAKPYRYRREDVEQVLEGTGLSWR